MHPEYIAYDILSNLFVDEINARWSNPLSDSEIKALRASGSGNVGIFRPTPECIFQGTACMPLHFDVSEVSSSNGIEAFNIDVVFEPMYFCRSRDDTLVFKVPGFMKHFFHGRVVASQIYYPIDEGNATILYKSIRRNKEGKYNYNLVIASALYSSGKEESSGPFHYMDGVFNDTLVMYMIDDQLYKLGLEVVNTYMIGDDIAIINCTGK
jgi:hypothetical protein